MLIILAIVLLIVLPGTAGILAFFGVLLLWFVELFAWNRTVKHRRRAVGAETLIGEQGQVTAPCRPLGQVRVGGELWEARCDAGAAAGDAVRIVGREKLTLIVEPTTQSTTQE
jgi:membrane-bound serine protease (ClpP class)